MKKDILKPNKKDTLMFFLYNDLFTYCANGDLDKIKYLLTSPEVEEKPNLSHENDYALKLACRKSQINIVEYFLNFPGYSSQYLSNLALQEAISTQNIDFINFLLTSDNLSYKADVHFNNDFIFYIALEQNDLAALEYLIFDFNIEKTEDIKKIILEMNKVEIERLFNVRELESKLKNNLESNVESTKKVKI